MVIVVPHDNLTPQQKAALTKKGMIVIECDQPERVKVIDTNWNVNIQSNDLLLASLNGLRNSAPTTKAEVFVNDLYLRLKRNEEDAKTIETASKPSL